MLPQDPKLASAKARANVLAHGPRVPDLQFQQLLTAPVDVALHC